MHGLHHVRQFNFLGLRQISNGSRHAQHPMHGARRPAMARRLLLHMLLRLRLYFQRLQLRRAQSVIADAAQAQGAVVRLLTARLHAGTAFPLR